MKRLLLILVVVFGLAVVPLVAQSSNDECINKSVEEKVTCYEAKLQENRGQQKTLASTIAYLDNRIALTQSQIAKTENDIKILEEEIATLGVKINRLDVSLDEISNLLIARIGESYKRSLFSPHYNLLAVGGLTDYLERNQYLKIAQQNDRKVLLELQGARDTTQLQKDLKEQKQLELEELTLQLANQNRDLAQQKSSKGDLLAQTKNDERVYQQLLATARAEYQAIQAIVALKGQETEVRHVSEGEKIATVIQGASCNSTGTHVHFIISENGVSKNPFSYLSSNISYTNYSGGDAFNPSGSWRWPIEPHIRFNQGYGVTWFVQTYGWYPFHNGIDITSESSNDIKAVKAGTLYNGSYSGSGGCTLPYVRVDHDENNLDTFYLHVFSS